MKKDIYIIKNDINSKVYVGQSIDALSRFKQHCKKSNKHSLISRAIKCYGKSHFFIELLEQNIENYNEREIYWINKYNSLAPNGYNVLSGGEEPPRMCGTSHPESKLTDKDISCLIYDLEYSDLTFVQLGKKYNIADSCVNSINQGKGYIVENVEYPIRKNPNKSGKLSDKQAIEIINILKTTYLSYEQIASKYDVKPRAISRLNSGLWHKQPQEKYPIRKFRNVSKKPGLTKDQVLEIVNLLINTNLSMRKIAKGYNVDPGTIIDIKNGKAKMYRIDSLHYPLRKNN